MHNLTPTPFLRNEGMLSPFGAFEMENVHPYVSRGSQLPERPKDYYWSDIITQIRSIKDWNQEQFSKELGSNQATVSRWEKGLVVPGEEKRLRIERLANELGVSTLNGIADVVRVSPYPMILTDKFSNVIAASKCSGFAEGESVIQQTPEGERQFFEAFERTLAQSKFWMKGGNRFDYEFSAEDGKRRAVLVSVALRDRVYAVVQQVKVENTEN